MITWNTAAIRVNVRSLPQCFPLARPTLALAPTSSEKFSLFSRNFISLDKNYFWGTWSIESIVNRSWGLNSLELPVDGIQIWIIHLITAIKDLALSNAIKEEMWKPSMLLMEFQLMIDVIWFYNNLIRNASWVSRRRHHVLVIPPNVDRWIFVNAAKCRVTNSSWAESREFHGTSLHVIVFQADSYFQRQSKVASYLQRTRFIGSSIVFTFRPSIFCNLSFSVSNSLLRQTDLGQLQLSVVSPIELWLL